MSLRTDQVASVLRRVVQEILNRGLNDPRVRGLISVTAVEVSDDLAQATVSVSVLPETQAELTIHGLRHAGRHIRTKVAEAVTFRRVPALTFKLDQSLKREARIIAAIDEARQTDDARRQGGPKSEEAST